MTVDLKRRHRLHPLHRPAAGPPPLRAPGRRRGRRAACSTSLRAYRNADGGFGHAIEPDMRGPVSQPVGVHTAMEILHEIGAARRPDDRLRAATGWRAIDARRRRHPVLPAERDRLPARAVVAAGRRVVAHADRGQRGRAARARRRATRGWTARASSAGGGSTRSTCSGPIAPGIGYDVRFARRVPGRRARRRPRRGRARRARPGAARRPAWSPSRAPTATSRRRSTSPPGPARAAGACSTPTTIERDLDALAAGAARRRRLDRRLPAPGTPSPRTSGAASLPSTPLRVLRATRRRLNFRRVARGFALRDVDGRDARRSGAGDADEVEVAVVRRRRCRSRRCRRAGCGPGSTARC